MQFEHKHAMDTSDKSFCDDSDSDDEETNLIKKKFTKFRVPPAPKKVKQKDKSKIKPVAKMTKGASFKTSKTSNKAKLAKSGTRDTKSKARNKPKMSTSKDMNGSQFSYNIKQSKVKFKKGNKEVSKRVETLATLKNMLDDLTTSRLTGSRLDKADVIANEFEDSNNTDAILRYLTDKKSSKLPIKRKKRKVMAVQHQEVKSDSVSDPYDETSDVLSPSNVSHHDNTDALNTQIDFNKPLLNSKMNLSNMLLNG